MITAQNVLFNPTPGSSHVAARKYIIDQLNFKTNKYINDGKIRLISCRLEKDSLVVHLQQGSESIQNLWYDIVFEFPKFRRIKATSNGQEVYNGISIKDTELKVFSNNPEFVFTYAYAFNRQNALIDKYKTLIGAKALSQAPKEKNPNAEIGMSSSLYICLKYLEMSDFFGNMRYTKFLNNVKSKPLSFSMIERRMKEFKNLNKKPKKK